MKLPLWRLLAGSAVLALLVTILLALAPVYLSNYRLQGFLRQMVASSSEPELRRKLLERARELSLPVTDDQVTITQAPGQMHVELRYAVRKDFGLYQVDLHFHPSAGK